MKRLLLAVMMLAVMMVATSCASFQFGSTGAEPWTPSGAEVLFVDHYDDGQLDADRWNTCHWWTLDGGCTIASNDELQWYQPANVIEADGVLRLEARIQAITNRDGDEFAFTSGMVTTGPPDSTSPAKFAFWFGGAEARIRVPAGAEFWPAFWLLPASTESRPEIDIMEMHGDEPTTNGLRLHSFDATGERISFNETVAGDDFTAGWHNFGVLWSRDQITWTIDGVPVKTLTSDNDLGIILPNEPLYVVLNLAIDSDAQPPLAGPDAFPAAVEVDWVQVWQFPTEASAS